MTALKNRKRGNDGVEPQGEVCHCYFAYMNSVLLNVGRFGAFTVTKDCCGYLWGCSFPYLEHHFLAPV